MSRRHRARRRRGNGTALALALVLATSSASAEPSLRVGFPHPFSREHSPGERYMGVRLAGMLKLEPIVREGASLVGLSALAWDEDEQLLYALSDRGVVFHLEVKYDDDGILTGAWLHALHRLRDRDGKPLRGWMRDAEGLVARYADNGRRGDTELGVSFERAHRVVRYSTRGVYLGGVALPRGLRDRARYQTSNRALESLAWHPGLGYLTAPELPFRDVLDGHVELHAIERRLSWRYPLAPEPNAGLTAIEVLADGSLLTLERGYGVFFVPVITTLRRVRTLPARSGAALAVETVARFSTGEGFSLDNFEGLTVAPPNRVLIASDDNARGFQLTLLAAFELLDRSADEPRRQDLIEFKDSPGGSSVKSRVLGP